jgi:gas vesicle protein
MKSKTRIFLFGLVVGVIIAFPLGMNVGRDAPLLSNPFAETEVKEKMADRMKESAGRALETTKEGAEKALGDAKEKLHEATKPIQK